MAPCIPWSLGAEFWIGALEWRLLYVNIYMNLTEAIMSKFIFGTYVYVRKTMTGATANFCGFVYRNIYNLGDIKKICI